MKQLGRGWDGRRSAGCEVEGSYNRGIFDRSHDDTLSTEGQRRFNFGKRYWAKKSEMSTVG